MAANGDAEAMSSSIARHLVLSGARTVGLLPLAARKVELDMVPVLERLAASLSMFMEGTVGYLGPWRGWGTAPLQDGRQALLLRPAGERIVEVVPPACASAPAASGALQRALASLPPTLARVLIDLGGYAAPGRLPAVSELLDGVVTVVATRRARRGEVADLYARMPGSKNLGAILIG